jgi:16S rRNA (guanine1207-N2)-methyltransferase
LLNFCGLLRFVMPHDSHYFSSSTPLAESALQWTQAQWGEISLDFATGKGVFARGGLDEGSKLLLESAELSGKAIICDLGCGWGAISCFAAARWRDSFVIGCDVNERAVALAHLNARRNGLTNAAFWCGDGLSALREECLDAVLCNPPVRAGNETIARLFEGAYRCLKTGGELWIVLRTAQGAKSWQKRLAAQFGTCDTIEIKHGYRILRSRKQEADVRKQEAGV